MGRYCGLKLLRHVLFAFALFTLYLGSSEAGQNPTGQEPVPSWRTWKVFYDSLAYYAKRSPEPVNQMLAVQFGLTRAQAASLLSAGQSYVATIQSIDENAKAEALRRYPDITGPPGSPSRQTTPRRTKTLPSGPQKKVRERAIQSADR
jgi:hypothetical protein